ncbi:MAG: NUDIX hydrolase [Acholeplasmataceae bacterium]|nr:MAG: NUDIX hydrolase [Acholeplasmataceae bacterium]
MIEKTKHSKEVYSCSFMALYEDEVILPNGKTSGRVYVKHPGAAAVLPIAKDGRFILIRQFRYPIRQVGIEIPAGKKDDSAERGLDCVKRELIEETGYQAGVIEPLMLIHNCLGYSDEHIEIFLARDCIPAEHPLQHDEDETIDVFLATPEEAYDLLISGAITDAKTIIALQHYFLNHPI